MDQQKNMQFERPAYVESDELSLIDLARILVRRRKVVYAIFSVVLLAGIAWALIVPRTYTFSSIYRMAEQEPGKSLQSASSVLVTTDKVYLPDAMSSQKQPNGGDDSRMRVGAKNPDTTDLIVLSTVGDEDQMSTIKRIHGAILSAVQKDDTKVFEQKKASLNAQLASVQKQLSELGGAADNQLAVASTLQSKASIEEQISALAPGQIVTLARRSTLPSGPGRVLIISLSFLLAGMLAILGGLFFEFVARVKQD